MSMGFLSLFPQLGEKVSFCRDKEFPFLLPDGRFWPCNKKLNDDPSRSFDSKTAAQVSVETNPKCHMDATWKSCWWFMLLSSITIWITTASFFAAEIVTVTSEVHTFQLWFEINFVHIGQLPKIGILKKEIQFFPSKTHCWSALAFF